MAGENNQQGGDETTLEGLEKGLQDLQRIAEGMQINKAMGNISIDQGGHVDERGTTSGGYPDTGDAGALDSMMIGKMADALIDAGFSAEMVAHMKAKLEEEEEEEGEGDEPDGEGGEPPPFGKFGKPADSSGSTGTNPRVRPTGGKGKTGGGKMGKSLDAFRDYTDDQGNHPIADALDVSPFLRDFVTAQAEQNDGLRKALAESHARNEQMARGMARVIHGIGILTKGIAAHANRLDQRLGLVERQPNPQRGVTAITPGVRPMMKALPREVGAPQQLGEALTKSEVCSVLSYLNLEKGVKEIGGQKTYEIAGLYEGGGTLSKAAWDTVQGFLAANPHLAETARTYR